MKIGIDGRPLKPPITGVGLYVLEVCRQLDMELPGATFYV